jgi:hypothetical protein
MRKSHNHIAEQGGEGANPTDRDKKGTKRSLLTEGKGIPLSVAVDGADRHDKKLMKATLDTIMIERPTAEEVKQNMCMDKVIIILMSKSWLRSMVILLIFAAVGRKIKKKANTRL